MSLRVEMPEITTESERFGTLRVEGGWEARVPELAPPDTDDVFRAHVRYRVQDGLSADEAEQDVRSRYLRGWISWYKRQLKYSIRGWAERYAEMHPELVADDGSLAGFDPERMQSCYFPFENTGRKGKPFARELMREMAQEAKNENG